MKTIIACAIAFAAHIAILILAEKASPPEPPYGWIFEETKKMEEQT